MSKLELRKTFGPLSAGTRVELLTQPTKSRKIVTVRTVTPPSARFREQNQSVVDPDTGIFDVPVKLLVEVR